ncbi:MAG: hypothetical protein ABIF40_04305 [archaeon]
MGIKFLLDETQKKNQETIAEILKVIEKKPYPDPNSTILANFIEELFIAGEKIHKKEVEAQQIKHIPKKIVFQPRKMALPIDEMPNIPIPSHKEPITKNVPEIPPIKRQEYVLNLFSNPIGVLVEEHPETHKFHYNIFEPILDNKFLFKVKQEIIPYIKKNQNAINDDNLLKQVVDKVAQSFGVQATSYMIRNVKYYLNRDLLGFRRLNALMHDEKVREIIVSGVNKPVKVKYAGIEYPLDTNVKFKENKDLNALILRIAQTAGKNLNERKPILNVKFEGYHIKGTMGVGSISSKLIIAKL